MSLQKIQTWSIAMPEVQVARQAFRPKSRRVLMIVQDLPVPYDRRTWLEATTLSQAGYTVSVICPQSPRFKASYECLEDIDIYRYPLPFEAYGVLSYILEFAWCFVMAFILSCRVHLFGRGFDVIHSCNPPETYWALARVWRCFGKRFLFDHHDLSPEMYEAKYKKRGGLLHKMLLWLERMTFVTAHTVIASNQSYRDIACRRGGVHEEAVFVVRSGPDTKRFQLREPEKALKQGRRYMCCYLGKMCEQDGVDYLVRVAKILAVDRQRDDLLFVFMGEGPDQPNLVRYAEQIGVSQHCHFTGYVSDDEICRYLSTTDIAVDPDPKTVWSDKSTMNKMMEYMFFGCPIVAFDLTENRYSARYSAVYIEPNCEVKMADMIEVLLQNETHRQWMSEYGKTRVRTELLWDKSVSPLLDAYDHLFRGTGLC